MAHASSAVIHAIFRRSRERIGRFRPVSLAAPARVYLLRMLLPMSMLFVLDGAAAEGRTPLPVIEAARAGTTCIADPATMRRDHPAMLEHQRDKTVHGGIRGAKASLTGCISCHASTSSHSVAHQQTNFCVSCHTYVAVKIDCFGCHTPRPQAKLARQSP